LHVAIVQQPMAWTTEGNVEHIVDAIALAAAQGGQLCLFPELALTGFHRRIREEAKPEIVEPALQRVRAACREAGVASLLGLPTFTASGAVRNSYAFVDVDGEVRGTVHKNGLTPSELTFFEAGSDRPVLRYAGRTCSTVMCREVEDVDAIAEQLAAEPVQLMFWPSIVGHPPGTVAEPEREVQDLGYVERAAEFARRLNTHLVQCNWPRTLNAPEARWQGHSKAYGPDGEVLLMLPRDEAGIGMFELGEREYRWLPLAA
ncbi:MAG TPA: nitrilase-related carbon-nitrogen hydrolase, partial [Burkholderiaceae bacterium]|nr:nitrilase-related carbon-nitrogen hydrolase [Burkholderiaceae bacterium]